MTLSVRFSSRNADKFAPQRRHKSLELGSKSPEGLVYELKLGLTGRTKTEETETASTPHLAVSQMLILRVALLGTSEAANSYALIKREG